MCWYLFDVECGKVLMKFVLVVYGICGDVEFCVVVGVELWW